MPWKPFTSKTRTAEQSAAIKAEILKWCELPQDNRETQEQLAGRLGVKRQYVARLWRQWQRKQLKMLPQPATIGEAHEQLFQHDSVYQRMVKGLMRRQPKELKREVSQPPIFGEPEPAAPKPTAQPPVSEHPHLEARMEPRVPTLAELAERDPMAPFRKPATVRPQSRRRVAAYLANPLVR